MEGKVNARMDVAIHIRTKLFGVYVGSDEQGNRYYRERRWRLSGGGRLLERRWVIYRGEAEASRVPAGWHGWLHHTIDLTPKELTIPDYEWLKSHKANQTGTPHAWHRKGSLLDGKRREEATGDYQPWMPSDYGS